MIYSNYICSSASRYFDYLFIMFKVASWTSTGKELISWLSNCAVISLCRLDLFVFFSRMVSGEGCGIRL